LRERFPKTEAEIGRGLVIPHAKTRAAPVLDGQLYRTNRGRRLNNPLRPHSFSVCVCGSKRNRHLAGAKLAYSRITTYAPFVVPGLRQAQSLDAIPGGV